MSIVPRFNNKEAEKREIFRLIGELKAYKTDRRDPRVEVARQLLVSELQNLVPSAQDQQIIFLLHGSMVFHDGIKNDADMLIFGPNYSVASRWYYENMSESEPIFDEKWKAIFPEPGHDFIYFSLDQLNERKRGYEDIRANSAAIILAGDLLFPQQVVWHKMYQGAVWQLVDQHDWLRRGVINDLKFSIAERKIRRGL